MSGFPRRFQKFSVCLSLLGLLAACGLSLAAVSSAQAFHCSGFPWCRAQALDTQGSAAVAHRLSCSAACDFLDQGLNPCPLYWGGRSSILIYFTTGKVLSHYFFSPSHLLWLHSIHCFSLWCTYFHCFLYSFHSLFVSLIGYFQLIFLLTYWFFFIFFLFLGQVVVESLYWILQFTHCIVFMLNHLCHVWLFVTPWTVAHQGPLSMGFTRQEYWSGLLCTPPGYLPDQGIEPVSLTSPVLADRFFTTCVTWKAHSFIIQLQNIWLFLFFF